MTDKKKQTPNENKADPKDQVIADLTEALQRERADSINLRRQHEAVISSIRQSSLIRVVRELLPAIDGLELSLKHVPEDIKDNDYVKGVQAVVKQFEKTFTELGIERIKTVGEPFDPRYHEAVHLDDSQPGEREVVSQELQAGYKLGDEVIRHAMVNVKLQN